MMKLANSRLLILGLIGFVVLGSSLLLAQGPAAKPANSGVLGAQAKVDLLNTNINWPAGWQLARIEGNPDAVNFACVGGNDCEFIEFRPVESNSTVNALRLSTPLAVRANYEGASPARQIILKFRGQDVRFTVEEFSGSDGKSITNFQIYGCTSTHICLQVGPLASDPVQNAKQFDTFLELVVSL